MSHHAFEKALKPTLSIGDQQQAADFGEGLHGLMLSLAKRLETETTELKAGRFAVGTFDIESKSNLIFRYRQALANVEANATSLSRFIPVKLDELRRLNTRLQDALQVNLAAVATAQGMSEQLLGKLAAKASAHKRPKTYGATGLVAKTPPASAMALDRAL